MPAESGDVFVNRAARREAADRIATIEVPPDVELYEGVVAENFGKIGGGPQTVIPDVDPKWVVGDEAFP